MPELLALVVAGAPVLFVPTAPDVAMVVVVAATGALAEICDSRLS
jgi:hypothetical protein